MKRAFDIVASGLGLLVLSPVLLGVALLIKLSSRGPVLFRHERVGRNFRPFSMYKFRTMVPDAPRLGGPLTAGDDPRITTIGRVLRKTKVDELPQLFNVLRGEMSLVGPRPPIPSEVERYEEWHHRRLEVTPGITGLWQVSGRSELSFDEMVMLDLYYIENWSLALDLQILGRTIPAVFRASGAF